MRSAGSIASKAPVSSRSPVKRSLADELGGEFEDVDLRLENTPGLLRSPNGIHEENTEEIRRVEHLVPKECVQSHGANTSAPDRTPGKSKFVEHLSPGKSSTEPTNMSRKDHVTLMASKHNRELIGRTVDGYFNMETMPTVTDVQRHVQQSEGIAALQRTLVPEKKTEAASSSSGCSQTSSSTAVDSVKRPSTLRTVTLAKPSGRGHNKIQGPFPYTGQRAQVAPRFSLGRDLIAAGHRKKLSAPSAPVRFVRLPTDPVVNFKRDFSEFNLKIRIPEPERDGKDSGSITSVPEVDSKGGLKLIVREPKPGKELDSKAPNGSKRLEFGIPRVFIANQCLESSCPLRWAHAKGPYHHKGHRHKKIMTGLFGHSNPPPEIWNAYRNMVQLTWDGEVISPNGRPRLTADEDLVIAFATFHYGQLNNMSGVEFHRLYAGRHMSSRISLQSSSTNPSKRSCGS